MGRPGELAPFARFPGEMEDRPSGWNRAPQQSTLKLPPGAQSCPTAAVAKIAAGSANQSAKKKTAIAEGDGPFKQKFV